MQNDMVTHGIASQLLAGLYMLRDCIDRCPSDEWNECHRDYPFSQVVFHTLFDCDYHLCDDAAEFKEQAFHRNNRENFGGYEELEDRVSRCLYERDFIDRYYEHCRARASSVIETKKRNDLVIPDSDVRGNMTKLERYINLIRHMQHHVAQLALRLQFITGKETDWVSRGYEK